MFGLAIPPLEFLRFAESGHSPFGKGLKGRGGPSIPGWSDFLSDCFKLK